MMHQLASVYAMTFYFGSMTRYRPTEYQQLLKSELGPFIEEFIHDYPKQFVFLLASEMGKREIACGEQI
jgi:hypothetical protein